MNMILFKVLCAVKLFSTCVGHFYAERFFFSCWIDSIVRQLMDYNSRHLFPFIKIQFFTSTVCKWWPSVICIVNFIKVWWKERNMLLYSECKQFFIAWRHFLSRISKEKQNAYDFQWKSHSLTCIDLSK